MRLLVTLAALATVVFAAAPPATAQDIVASSSIQAAVDAAAIGNTSGIVTFVLPGLAVPVSEDVMIERNVVLHNNHHPLVRGRELRSHLWRQSLVTPAAVLLGAIGAATARS